MLHRFSYSPNLALSREDLWLCSSTVKLPKWCLLHHGCVLFYRQLLCFLTFPLLWWMIVTGVQKGCLGHKLRQQPKMVLGQCELPAGSSAFLCVWEGQVRAGSWSISVLVRDNCSSLVPAQQLSQGSCLMAWERETSSWNTGSLGCCCWHLCLLQHNVLMSLYAQSLCGTTSTTPGEGFRAVGGSVDHYSSWSGVFGQDNPAVDLCKHWLQGVNEVVTYPCPSSFTCTFWSITLIAFWLLFPHEKQSQQSSAHSTTTGTFIFADDPKVSRPVCPCATLLLAKPLRSSCWALLPDEDCLSLKVLSISKMGAN